MVRLISLLLLIAAPAAAEPVSLAALSKYINGLETVQTNFTQYNADGSRSKGTLYMKRPGRMKFEYAPPNDAMVVANNNLVAIFDAKSNAEPQQYPLKRTPLNLILGKNVDLTTADMVVGHYETETGLTAVAARDPKQPDAGMIELFFTADPIALTQWVITDESGTRTGVALGPFDESVEIPNYFFSITAEARSRAD